MRLPEGMDLQQEEEEGSREHERHQEVRGEVVLKCIEGCNSLPDAHGVVVIAADACQVSVVRAEGQSTHRPSEEALADGDDQVALTVCTKIKDLRMFSSIRYCQ